MAVIRVYADAGNVIETHEHTGDFKEWPKGLTIAVNLLDGVTDRRAAS